MLKFLSRALRVGVGLLALAAAIAVYQILVVTKPQVAKTVGLREPLRVAVMQLDARRVPRSWTGYGTARALDASDLAAEVGGRIVERPPTIEAGVRVGRGELIVRIDPSDYEQAVASARRNAEALRAELAGLEVDEARLGEQIELAREEIEAARRDLERARESVERGAGNESQLDQARVVLQSRKRSLAALRQQSELIPTRRSAARARLAAAEADLRLAERNLERTEIRAPFAGSLQSVDAEVGEWAGVGQTIARIVDLSRLEVPLRLPVSASGSLTPGDRVELRPDGEDLSEPSWSGEVQRIAPEADRDTRTLTVFAVFEQEIEPGAAGLLRPGRFVMGEVTASSGGPRLVLPRRVVTDGAVLVARALPEDDPALDRFDLSNADRIRRVQRVPVRVDRPIRATFPDLAPAEREWVVLGPGGPSGLGPTDDLQLRPGDLVILSNLDQLRPGDVIDARMPAGAGGRARAAEGDSASASESTPVARQSRDGPGDGR